MLQFFFLLFSPLPSSRLRRLLLLRAREHDAKLLSSNFRNFPARTLTHQDVTFYESLRGFFFFPFLFLHFFNMAASPICCLKKKKTSISYKVQKSCPLMMFPSFGGEKNGHFSLKMIAFQPFFHILF